VLFLKSEEKASQRSRDPDIKIELKRKVWALLTCAKRNAKRRIVPSYFCAPSEPKRLGKIRVDERVLCLAATKGRNTSCDVFSRIQMPASVDAHISAADKALSTLAGLHLTFTVHFCFLDRARARQW
jgi:hypothetical protein